MSGKKLCEVKSVLRNAGDIQKDLFNNYLERCEEFMDEIHGLSQEAAVRECSDAPDADKLQNKLKRSSGNIKKFVDQLQNLEQQVERKARGSSNGWWFDDEFNRATAIQNDLSREMSGSVRPLQQDLEDGLQKAKGCLEQAEERKKAQAQAALEQFRNKVETARYRNPLDKDDIMTMDRFCEIILGDTEESNWAAASLKNLESFQKNEKWDTLLENYKTLNRDLDTRIAGLEQRCEEEQNKMATVVAIEKFLYDEGCEFESSIIGEQHLADGVYIRTVKTSRPVEFTIGSNNESGEDDGTTGTSVSFNVDNLQGEENCASSVERLRRGLQKMGIDPGKAVRINGNNSKNVRNRGRSKGEDSNTAGGK